MVDLREYYNKLYSEGKEKYWNDYSDSNQTLSGSRQFIIDLVKRKNLNPSSILDFGCGEGNFLNYFSKKANKIRVGIDFSSVAIEKAKSFYPKINFILGSEDKIEGTYDFVTSIGVIEHTDDPALHFKKLYIATNRKGHLFIVCPNHCNTRGIIWQTLSLLFDFPIFIG
ncbi:MAG: class I SAM-dependent methyltransferase [Candidatus Marinimicrobia bacterium]|nr:class I SAM-dependent methyltransferase [Candidatus Neomarinimicrobiota bacterium]